MALYSAILDELSDRRVVWSRIEANLEANRLAS